jgi:hypothetical protein
MFQVFHLFQTYVVSVSFGCFKSRSWRSTCCNCVMLLLHRSPHVSKVCCCCVVTMPPWSLCRLVLRACGHALLASTARSPWVSVFQKYTATHCCVGHHAACTPTGGIVMWTGPDRTGPVVRSVKHRTREYSGLVHLKDRPCNQTGKNQLN